MFFRKRLTQGNQRPHFSETLQKQDKLKISGLFLCGSRFWVKEMSSGSAAVCVFDSDDGDGAKNRNISELISTLRTAYRTKDFDRVEEILVSREAKLKREMQDMKKENGFLYEQGEELKRLVVLEKAAQDAAQVGERKAVERYEKLLEEVKRGGGRDDDKRVILELKKKCCVLECAKMKAESEVELWKRRFKELGIRVSKLEEDTAMLMDLQSAGITVLES